MSGRRIEVTKDAMKLFMKSLPVGSKFQIISFGTTHSSMILKSSELKPVSKSKKPRIFDDSDSSSEYEEKKAETGYPGCHVYNQDTMEQAIT